MNLDKNTKLSHQYFINYVVTVRRVEDNCTKCRCRIRTDCDQMSMNTGWANRLLENLGWTKNSEKVSMALNEPIWACANTKLLQKQTYVSQFDILKERLRIIMIAENQWDKKLLKSDSKKDRDFVAVLIAAIQVYDWLRTLDTNIHFWNKKLRLLSASMQLRKIKGNLLADGTLKRHLKSAKKFDAWAKNNGYPEGMLSSQQTIQQMNNKYIETLMVVNNEHKAQGGPVVRHKEMLSFAAKNWEMNQLIIDQRLAEICILECESNKKDVKRATPWDEADVVKLENCLIKSESKIEICIMGIILCTIFWGKRFGDLQKMDAFWIKNHTNHLL